MKSVVKQNFHFFLCRLYGFVDKTERIDFNFIIFLYYNSALTAEMKSSIILTIFEPIITPSADRPGRSDTYLFGASQGFTGEKLTRKPLSLGQIALTFNDRSGILVILLYLDSDKLI